MGEISILHIIWKIKDWSITELENNKLIDVFLMKKNGKRNNKLHKVKIQFG